jgi:hypothetical protein
MLLLQVADKNALLLLKQYRNSQWRVDKLANRVAFERAIAAIRLLSTAAQDGASSSSSSNKQQQLSYYGSAPVDAALSREVRPHDDIVNAITCQNAAGQQQQQQQQQHMLPRKPFRVPYIRADVAALCARPALPSSTSSGYTAVELLGRYCSNISRLNTSQLQAVQAATARRLTLIHGPPG